MNTKAKFNVVIPRVGLDKNGDFYAKDVAYDIDLIVDNQVTFGVPYGKQYTIAFDDSDFLICFGVTLKELHDMGYFYVSEDDSRPYTSRVANAVKKAYEECCDNGYASVDCGDYIIEAENFDNDDGSAFIEMVILNKYGKVLCKWYEE